MSTRGPYAVALLGALATAAGGVAIAGGGSERPKPPSRAELDRTVAGIERFVERTRGLRYKHPPRLKWIAPDEKFEMRPAKPWKRIKETELMEKMVGIAAPDRDLSKDQVATLQVGARGRYDNQTKTVIVRAGELTPAVRVTLAHELTHALDDQWFGLEPPKAVGARTDRGDAFSAMMEGSAMWLQEQYMRSMSSSDVQAVAREYGTAPSGAARKPPASSNSIVQQAIDDKYAWGAAFVTAVVKAGGTRALDRAFQHPPYSMAEVIEPERYLAGRRPLVLPFPHADGTPFDKAGMGAVTLGYMIRKVAPALAPAAVRAWAGGRYISWRDAGGRPCMRATVASRTVAGARDIARGLQAWAASGPNRSVTRVRKHVTFVSCLPETAR